ncbi:hypothetical protein FPV67DRAFT_292863 [Lyophyllum atratum]|nr:hypothetical protein FPV67DRAFT_292863 [Lyophyllum atratum]
MASFVGGDRSTYDIVQSCLLTLYICTWVTIHVGIKPPDRHVKNMMEKLFYSFAAVLVPEIMLSMAFMDWYEARESLRMIRRWTKKCREKAPHNADDFKFADEWTMTHSMFHHMSGFRASVDGQPRIPKRPGIDPTHDIIYTPANILFLAQRNIVSLTELEHAIDDRSKADALSKAVACTQVFWFLIKCAARVQRRLPITELEVTTASFVIICMTCYLFWWNKPMDVKTHVYIYITQAQANEMLKYTTDEHDLRTQRFWVDNFDGWIRTTLSLFGAVFGGLHCLAWSIHFPTTTERLLWRISSLCITFIPPVGTYLYHGLKEHSFKHALWPIAGIFASPESSYYGQGYRNMKIGLREWRDAVAAILMIFLGLAYVTARLTLIVEAFTCLRSMPEAVHTNVDWTTYIPHL